MRTTLHLRLTFVVGIISLITAFIISWRYYDQSYMNEQSESLKNIKQLSMTVYNSAAIAAYVNNKMIAEDVITGLMKNELVQAAGITTNDMKIFQKKSENFELKPYEIDLTSPFDNEILGRMVIYPNQTAIHVRAQNTALNLVKMILLVIVLISSLIMFLIWILIGRPLRIMSSDLKDIEPSEYSSRLNVPNLVKNTELDQFTITVNELLDKVKEQLNKERSLREQLSVVTKNVQLMFNLSNHAIIVVDPFFNIQYSNPAFERLLSLSSAEVFSPHHTFWLKKLVEKPDGFVNNILKMVHDSTVDGFDIHTKDKNTWLNITAVKAFDALDKPIMMVFFKDITKEHHALDESEKAANFDYLTRLMNRRVAEKQINHMIRQNVILNQIMALFIIDLDGFKQINDIYGHDAGDIVLKTIALRLKSLCRRSDIIARWGGDEFVVALDDISPIESLNIADKLLHTICLPITLDKDDQELVVHVGASIGIVLCPTHSQDFHDAFEKADVTMYQVKQSGKNGYRLYQ